MKKLKLYLEQIENTIVMRVLEQEGITEDLSQIILVDKTPSMGACYLYLRGEIKRYDHETNCRLFDTN